MGRVWALFQAVEEIWSTKHEVNNVKAKLDRLNIDSFDELVDQIRVRQGGCIMNRRLKGLGEHSICGRSLLQLRRKLLFPRMTRIMPFSSSSSKVDREELRSDARRSVSTDRLSCSDGFSSMKNERGSDLRMRRTSAKFFDPEKSQRKWNVVFTAPHNIPLFREGGIHKKEDYTTFIAMQWSQLNSGALLAWSRSEQERCGKMPSHRNLDPNYLHIDELDNNSWYLSLREIREKLPHKRLLHIDIHGCYVKQHEPEIFLGLGPLEERNPELCELFRQALTRRLLPVLARYSPNQVLEPRPKGRFTANCRGKDRLTLSQQSMRLNYDLALQIELSYPMRRHLFEDPVFREEVGEVFLDAAEEVLPST